ncbi:hypothetical protein HYPSUDRAFT_411292 [Hypholoma sublateritium FD-334 SS-4]|uniref:Uncharacterized protein n=1 Tax=Hypholoma sublateritium (strain FD-334 SS-4) TaxID=945553 RepID=A0A0D2LVY5_HYPSF|nr:hypothetical protein HYPSUDRAFT_411292 [Hypholoma sublateritium FD-334 SS-4]
MHRAACVVPRGSQVARMGLAATFCTSVDPTCRRQREAGKRRAWVTTRRCRWAWYPTAHSVCRHKHPRHRPSPTRVRLRAITASLGIRVSPCSRPPTHQRRRHPIPPSYVSHNPPIPLNKSVLVTLSRNLSPASFALAHDITISVVPFGSSPPGLLKLPRVVFCHKFYVFHEICGKLRIRAFKWHNIGVKGASILEITHDQAQILPARRPTTFFTRPISTVHFLFSSPCASQYAI